MINGGRSRWGGADFTPWPLASPMVRRCPNLSIQVPSHRRNATLVLLGPLVEWLHAAAQPALELPAEGRHGRVLELHLPNDYRFLSAFTAALSKACEQ
jgi:hypothetical protein